MPSRRTILPRRVTASRALSIEDVRRYSARYGLRAVGGRETDDRLTAHVLRLLAEWRWTFDQDAVPWSTLVAALAQDAQMRDHTDGYDYLDESDYRSAAEWTLLYVVNHLDRSGMAVVRLE